MCATSAQGSCSSSVGIRSMDAQVQDICAQGYDSWHTWAIEDDPVRHQGTQTPTPSAPSPVASVTSESALYCMDLKVCHRLLQNCMELLSEARLLVQELVMEVVLICLPWLELSLPLIGRWTCHSTGSGRWGQGEAPPDRCRAKRAHRAKDSFPRGSTIRMI